MAPDEEESYLLAILDSPEGLDAAEFLWHDPESPDGCYRAWDFHWCTSGDTVIYTDQGRRQIKDLVGPVRLLTAGQGDRGEWVDAKVRSFGTAWLWQVEIERRGIRRTLHFTGQHRHFAGPGRADRRSYLEKKTFELRPGDHLQPTTSPQQPFGLDAEWVRAGVVYGDGTVFGGRSRVLLFNEKRALVSWFPDAVPSVPPGQPDALYVGRQPSWYKTALPGVGSSKAEELWGWLAGYFATDGSVLPDGTCQITSVNLGGLFHLRDVATALGIVVGAVGHRQRTMTLPNGKSHTCIEGRVTLRISDLPLEFFLNPKHADRAAIRLAGQRDRAVDAWMVVSVTPNVKREEVFCAVVEGTHSFVLDGDILTGNSWYLCDDMYQVSQGGRSLGKRLAVDTPIPTPTGWTMMGDLCAGDFVLDDAGRPTRVTAAHPIELAPASFEVVFSDGSIIVADAEHLWETRTKIARLADARGTTTRSMKVQARREAAVRLRADGMKFVDIARELGYKDKGCAHAACRAGQSGRETVGAKKRVVTTDQIRKTLMHGGAEHNHSVQVTQPLDLPHASLPIDPYVLGAWLGDGTSRTNEITIGLGGEWLLDELPRHGVRVTPRALQPGRSPCFALEFDRAIRSRKVDGFQATLRRLNVLRNKHIPAAYLRASVEQRRALLAGLFDTDGHITKASNCELSQVSEVMARGVFELLASLGEHPHFSKSDAQLNGIVVGPRYRVTWRPICNPALMPRKAVRFRPLGQHASRVTQRRIIAVRPVPPVLMRCISVDSPSHLYLAGEAMIPTHNTVSITMRAFALPFAYPGSKMLVTAPELNHLRPLTDAIENRLMGSWLMRQMLPQSKGHGFTRQPHWMVKFTNGAQIVSRLPNKDGKGVKGCLASSHTITCYGQPMLITGTVVLTRRGNIPIEQVVQGDEVLTHLGRWRKVGGTFHYKDTPVYQVAGGGHRGLLMSETHDMYARRNRNPQRTVNLEPPTWITPATEHPEEIDKRWYFGSPTTVPSEPLPPLPMQWDAEALLVIAGMYVADGNTNHSATFGGPCRGITITDDVSQVDRIVAAAARLGLETKVYNGVAPRGITGARRIQIDSRPLGDFLIEHFGRLSAGKRIPVWLQGADEPLRRAFLEAYLKGDGWWDEKKERWQASSASKELIIDLRLLGQSLGWTCGYSWVDPKVTEIMGVKLKALPQRSHRLNLARSGRNAVVENNVSWQKIRSVEPAGDVDVYDLYVEDDNSYIADGLISHNQHVLFIELDEAQDYPLAGWIEVVETLNRFQPGAMYRAHGVPKGVRDKFYEMTEGAHEGDRKWKTHRPQAMNRPSWSEAERDEKIKEYGGSRQNIDYKRNIYGEHGDRSNSVFVISRLLACTDTDEGSEYNTEVYARVQLEFERLPTGPDVTDDIRQASLLSMIDLPGTHLSGYSQKVAGREVGSPKGYSAYWGGADIGVTNHPSEFLIFGQRMGTDELELLTRINLQRINTDDQKVVIEYLFAFYGSKLKVFALDRTGVGFPIWDQLTRYPKIGDRIRGYNFSEKVPVAFEDRPLVGAEKQEDLAIWRNVVEATTDFLRNDYVDTKRLRLPYDREILLEFQGQVFTVIRDTGNPYGQRRLFGGGSFHCVDSATEILTERGWRRYDQVATGDSVLTLQMESGTSRWSDIDALSIFQGPAKMTRSVSAAHDSLTTSNHRWPVRTYDVDSDSYGALHYKTTCTLAPDDCVPTAVPYAGAPLEAVYTDFSVRTLTPSPRFLLSLTAAQLELFVHASESSGKDLQQDMADMARALAGIAKNSGRNFVRPAGTQHTQAYEGIVWCPSTRDGNWLARRNGHLYWTGNTLDATKMMIGGKVLPPILAMLQTQKKAGPVLDVFLGA